MMSEKTLRELENQLLGLSGELPTEDGKDPLHFHNEGYPSLLWHYEKAKADMAKLGITEVVETAIRDCLVLLQQSRRAEAHDLLCGAARMLMVKSGRIDKYRLTPSELEERQAREAAAEARRIKRSLARKPRELRLAFDSEDNPRPEIVDPEASPLQQAEQLAVYLCGQGVDPDKALQQANGAIIEQYFKRFNKPGPSEQNTPQMAAEIGVLLQRAVDASAAEFNPEAAAQLRLEGVQDRVAAVQPMLEELERAAGVVGKKKNADDNPR